MCTYEATCTKTMEKKQGRHPDCVRSPHPVVKLCPGQQDLARLDNTQDKMSDDALSKESTSKFNKIRRKLSGKTSALSSSLKRALSITTKQQRSPTGTRGSESLDARSEADTHGSGAIHELPPVASLDDVVGDTDGVTVNGAFLFEDKDWQNGVLPSCL